MGAQSAWPKPKKEHKPTRSNLIHGPSALPKSQDCGKNSSRNIQKSDEMSRFPNKDVVTTGIKKKLVMSSQSRSWTP